MGFASEFWRLRLLGESNVAIAAKLLGSLQRLRDTARSTTLSPDVSDRIYKIQS